jgi:hypothetical protein
LVSLTMEGARPSETLINYESTWNHIPGYSILHQQGCDNLRSHVSCLVRKRSSKSHMNPIHIIRPH